MSDTSSTEVLEADEHLPPKKRPKTRGPRRRAWFFTDNGEAGEKGSTLVAECWKDLPEGVTYLSWQLEAGEKTGHPHLQGHLELKKAQYLSWLHKNVSKTASFRVRIATAKQCDVYCHKEEGRLAGPFTLGTPSKGQGARTDLAAMIKGIKEGRSIRQLADDDLKCAAKHLRFIQFMKGLYRPKYDPEAPGTQVVLLYGATGTGKTKSVYDQWANSDDFYEMPIATSALWWDGFDDHKYVLMDDFCGASSHMRLDTLLKILDRYTRRVPVKGSFAWYHPQGVVLTTNIHPIRWYNYEDREEQYRALARRFTEVYVFKEEGITKAKEDFWKFEELHDNDDNGMCCHSNNYCTINTHKHRAY